MIKTNPIKAIKGIYISGEYIISNNLGVSKFSSTIFSNPLPIETNKNNEEIIYDRYKGLKELIPFAKAVSAKSYDFDHNGNETTIDYYKMIEIHNSIEHHILVQ